jgi:hypothetical protein
MVVTRRSRVPNRELEMSIGSAGHEAQRVVPQLEPDDKRVLKALRTKGRLDDAGVAGVVGMPVSRARAVLVKLMDLELVQPLGPDDDGQVCYELAEGFQTITRGVREVSAEEVKEISGEDAAEDLEEVSGAARTDNPETAPSVAETEDPKPEAEIPPRGG